MYEPQQRSSDAALDTLGHGLPIPSLKIVEPVRDTAERVWRDLVLRLE